MSKFSVKELYSHDTKDSEVLLAWSSSYNIYADPKHLTFVLSRYKFAAQMMRHCKSILELGCSEGIGVPILTEFCERYSGIDSDSEAVQSARQNWNSSQFDFIAGDFLNQELGQYDGIVSLDVIEHIEHSQELCFLKTVFSNLNDDGMCVIGTPNITSASYASVASQRGHVNLFDAPRLAKTMERIFHNVFIFGMNDETVHTGFSPMAHYLIAVGCFKKKEIL